MSVPSSLLPSEEDDIYSLQAKITSAKSTIKQLKKDGAPSDEIAAATSILLACNAKFADIQKLNEPKDPFKRKTFDELLLRKMYVVPSFEIHNGPAGLFDYGPPACSLKSNILNLWRRHFPQEESMLEMECTNLTPSVVLETSGHVERFTDFMVKDEKTGECFRADKLLEDVIDNFLDSNPGMPQEEADIHRVIQRQADAYSAEELHLMLQKYNTKSPSNAENDITFPFPFNLMFKTTIGPEGTSVGYLRPETAQGLFVNFRRLLDYNQQKMPFAAAQIGLAFRNEISPRNGLLRVREFCMAEIEHFVNPNDKSHPKFKLVHDKELTLFTADNQLGSGRSIKISIKEAVETNIVDNETLAYFMTRTQLYLEKIGVDPERMRFRQHLKTEMAHYATDCWDMEIHMSYGWIECVGHADRACYDLEVHSKKTNVSMCAAQLLKEPILVDKMIAEPNKKLLGPRFKLDQKLVIKAIEGLEDEAVLKLQKDLEDTGESVVEGFTITTDLITFKNVKKTVSEVKFMPSVIEPSFGMGRILYAVLEHSFSQRNGDENRCVMAFKPCIAPIKVGIFKLVNNPIFDNIVDILHNDFQDNNISNKVDSSSGTVGRKYSRADELGIPFGITVDFDSLLDNCVTVRDRDTMSQVRVPISNINSLIMNLVSEKINWAWVMGRYMVVNEGGDDEDDKKKIATVSKNTFIEFTTRGNFTRPNPK